MYRAVVKLDTLSDTDRTGTKHHDLLLILIHLDFGFAIVAGIIIWCLCFKLSRTGIYDLVGCMNTITITKLLDFLFLLACNLCDYLVRKLHALCFLHHFLSDLRCLTQQFFFLYNIVDLIDKPDIYLRNIMDFLCGDSTAQCFCDDEDSAIINAVQHLMNFLCRKIIVILVDQAVHMLFQGTKCLHKCTLEVRTDTHNLTGCLHLRRQLAACLDELIERKSRHLNYNIIKCRLKACICLTCDSIFNLIQIISKCNLRSHLRNRISGCLRSKCRRTAYPRVYLDYTIFKCRRMQCKLYVTSPLDTKLCNDI